MYVAPMLAEIFMLCVEAARREASNDAPQFVPITLPAAPPADAKYSPGGRRERNRNGDGLD